MFGRMFTDSISKKLREAETQYQNFKSEYGVTNWLPTHLAQLFVTIISIVDPELGLLFCLSYLIGRLSNDKIPSVRTALGYYDNFLSAPENPNDERPLDQSYLVRQGNLLVNIPSVMAEVLIPAELQLVANFLTRRLTQHGDSLVGLIDRKADQYLRQQRTDELAKLNYRGACYGLEIIWYAYTLLNRGDEFFSDIQEISQINHSVLPGATLTNRQIKLLQAIAYAQNNQYKTLSLNLPGITGVGFVKVQIELDNNSEEFFLDGKSIDVNLQHIVKHIFKLANEQPNNLIHLSIRDNETKAHAIGVVGYNNSNTKYFDSNFRCADFQNTADAINNLYRLLRFNYSEYFTGNKSGSIKITTIKGHQLNFSSMLNINSYLRNHRHYSSPLADMAISTDMIRHACFRSAAVMMTQKMKNTSIFSRNAVDPQQKDQVVISSRVGFNK